MEWNGWQYAGDVNIRHGGFYWRSRENPPESVDIVQIVPLADAGGPDNLFLIRVGEIDVSRDILNEARLSSGIEAEDTNLGADVQAMIAYSGLDNIDEEWALRIGGKDEFWQGRGPNPEPLKILRSNTSLRKWLQREYLHAEQVSPAMSL